MKSSLRWTVLILSTAVPGFCQLAAEHAAAIAGGGIGLVAGKPMSKAIDKVFTEVEKAPTKKAKAAPSAKTKEPEPEKNASTATPLTVKGPGYSGGGDPATVGSSGGGSASSPSSQTRPARVRAKRASRHEPEISRPIDDVEETAPQRVEATVIVPDVSRIQEGMGRTQVLTILGDPSYHVTIPDEGHMREVFGFTAGNRWLGTVRMDNGEVVQVETPR